jgi:hypothetical protein
MWIEEREREREREREIWNLSWFPKAVCELGTEVNLVKDVRYTG